MAKVFRFFSLAALAACASTGAQPEGPPPAPSGQAWAMPDGGVPFDLGPTSPDEIWELSVQVYGERPDDPKPPPEVRHPTQDEFRNGSRGIRRLRRNVRRCLEAALKADPNLVGMTRLKVRVKEGGQPKVTVEPGVAPAELERCLVDGVRNVRFPISDGRWYGIMHLRFEEATEQVE